MNDAPVDIVVTIIEQSIQAAQAELTSNMDFKDGYITALEDLKDKLEGFKKLFN